MQTPEYFILSHGSAVYNPAKAHDYYLRTRKLKGRKKGSKKVSSAITNKNLGAVVKNGKVIHEPSVPTLSQRRQAQVQQRVKALRTKLAILNLILKKLVDEADSSSKKTTKRVSTREGKTSTAGLDKKRKPLTAIEKREAAKKQRVRYKKEHPDAGKVKDAKNQKKIEEVKRIIEDTRSQLKAALARARKIAGNKPAASQPPNS